MSEVSTILTESRALRARTEQLVREFHPQVPAGMVIGVVTRCRRDLVRSGVRAGLATATEAMARARLAS